MGLPVPQDKMSSLVKEAQVLIAKKDDIESQIHELEEGLQLQGVGMDESLIDSSGFPRSDVDVATARTFRNLVHRLRNDHKDIMKEIESALHAVHEETRKQSSTLQQEQKDQGENSTTKMNNNDMEQEDKKVPSKKPFALVNAVAPDSPADKSGLQRNDKVIQFGNIHAENHDRLQALNRLVGQSEDKSIQVIILRNDQSIIELVLTPKKWSGRGTLGCHIVSL
ncbi:hypothetical protein INT45_006544 [Circinella minor]|uniref:Probable 26S proteasome regulatory subunit p27 n=1 Tax=Circinella minor TaxID=1195481 RepID=A0A8H7VL05_9FUNG|nr:hypothetical protein INT45_006544 [Circinella minor]